MERYENPNEPDVDIEEVLAAHDESYDPSRRPIHLDSVFNALKIEQAQLAERCFLSVEAAETYINEFIIQFEQECAEKQIISQSVRMMGAYLMVPVITKDPFTGEYATKNISVDQIETDLPLLVHHQGIDGFFMGLGYTLEVLKGVQQDDDCEIPCQIHLCYQIGVGNPISHHNGVDMPAATGDVATSSLEFTCDRRRREFDTVYTILHDEVSPQAERYIEKLIMILSQYDDYSLSTLKDISNLIDLITQCDDFTGDVAKNDALEELLRLNIGLQSTYAISTPDELEKTSEGYIPRVTDPSGEPIFYSQKLAGIVLAPRYYKRESKFMFCQERKVPYFVAIGEDEKVHYRPMGRMKSFTKEV